MTEITISGDACGFSEIPIESNLRKIGDRVFAVFPCEGEVKIPRPRPEEGTKIET
jgi:hypothetical protein